MEPIGLSIKEAGVKMGGETRPLSRNTIYRMLARGELEALKIGSRTLVTIESIKAAMAAAPRLRA